MKTITEPGADGSGGVYELSRQEGREMFDRRARDALGISGEEFLARYDRGDPMRDPEDIGLLMLVPFVR